jgi:hypothetical protein
MYGMIWGNNIFGTFLFFDFHSMVCSETSETAGLRHSILTHQRRYTPRIFKKGNMDVSPWQRGLAVSSPPAELRVVRSNTGGV